MFLILIVGHHGGYGVGGYKKDKTGDKQDSKKEAKKSKKEDAKMAKEDKKEPKKAEKANGKATEDKAQAAAVPVPQPGQAAAPALNWGNLKLATSDKPDASATKSNEEAPVAEEQSQGNVKNWWKVGDGHVHWGHDHWGPAHDVHHHGGGWEYGHTGMKHGHGYYKSQVIKVSDASLYCKIPHLKTYYFASQFGVLNNEYNGLVLLKQLVI